MGSGLSGSVDSFVDLTENVLKIMNSLTGIRPFKGKFIFKASIHLESIGIFAFGGGERGEPRVDSIIDLRNAANLNHIDDFAGFSQMRCTIYLAPSYEKYRWPSEDCASNPPNEPDYGTDYGCGGGCYRVHGAVGNNTFIGPPGAIPLTQELYEKGNAEDIRKATCIPAYEFAGYSKSDLVLKGMNAVTHVGQHAFDGAKRIAYSGAGSLAVVVQGAFQNIQEESVVDLTNASKLQIIRGSYHEGAFGGEGKV